jgi:hypothetical protein
MSNGNGGDSQGSAGAAHNVWDAVVALIVVGALVVLVIYLVNHYRSDTEKIGAVLGVAAPVLAAAFGVSIGYYSGNKAGQSTGKKEAKREINSKLSPLVATLEGHLGNVLDPVQTQLESPEGEASFRGPSGTGPTIRHEDIDGTREAVAMLKGIVAAG